MALYLALYYYLHIYLKLNKEKESLWLNSAEIKSVLQNTDFESYHCQYGFWSRKEFWNLMSYNMVACRPKNLETSLPLNIRCASQ